MVAGTRGQFRPGQEQICSWSTRGVVCSVKRFLLDTSPCGAEGRLDVSPTCQFKFMAQKPRSVRCPPPGRGAALWTPLSPVRAPQFFPFSRRPCPGLRNRGQPNWETK